MYAPVSRWRDRSSERREDRLAIAGRGQQGRVAATGVAVTYLPSPPPLLSTIKTAITTITTITTNTTNSSNANSKRHD
ncbi:hypothetical protein E2C01_068816 [Portunus trituberculatus]|uniref:Uncharacterized protein n=1 Tax=Portunus trituberculatus TaxID=210409 RepID=A0A5B7HYW4_PORTR|nr:hypothetical protein [Portunus trituberculatus]